MRLRIMLATMGMGLIAFGSVHAQTTASPSPAQTAATPASGVLAAPQVRNINLGDPSGYMQASLTGDQDRLALIASTTSDGPDVLSKALRERSLYQLDASNKTVAACGDRSQIAHSTANSFCALILAGNDLLANDISGWAKLMDFNRKTMYPALAKLLFIDVHQLHVDGYEASADYSKFFDVPPVSVERKVSTFNLPLDWVTFHGNDHVGLHLVTVTVNGKPVRMVLDTGTSVVVLNPDDAKAAGIGPLREGWLKPPAGGRADLGVAKEVIIGGVHITNMPVLVPTTPLKYSVLGLSALQYLGAMHLQKDTLTSSATGFAPCQTPIDMSSKIDGTLSALVVRGVVDQKHFPFLLDTGSAWGIDRNHYGQPSSSVDVKTIGMSIGGAPTYSWYSMSHETMQIGDMPEAEQEVRVLYNKDHTLFRYEIGADYIRQHDLIIDFVHGQLCLK